LLHTLQGKQLKGNTAV